MSAGSITFIDVLRHAREYLIDLIRRGVGRDMDLQIDVDGEPGAPSWMEGRVPNTL